MKKDNLNSDVAFVRNKRGILVTDEMSCSQASRCLECSTICESCMDVCQTEQILLCTSKENHKLFMLIGCVTNVATVKHFALQVPLTRQIYLI